MYSWQHVAILAVFIDTFLFNWSPAPSHLNLMFCQSVMGFTASGKMYFVISEWKKFFTPVVHLIINLNNINPVSYKTPVKMYLGQRCWFISWRFACFTFYYIVIIPTPVQFATFFVAHCTGICNDLFSDSSYSCIILFTVSKTPPPKKIKVC
jgi:hypothetical protein